MTSKPRLEEALLCLPCAFKTHMLEAASPREKSKYHETPTSSPVEAGLVEGKQRKSHLS